MDGKEARPPLKMIDDISIVDDFAGRFANLRTRFMGHAAGRLLSRMPIELFPDLESISIDDHEDFEILHQYELYKIESFTQAENPAGAIRLQQIQGESYENEGYVYSSGLDKLGRLHADLDRSRGKDVIYYLAEPIKHEEGRANEAGLRVKAVPEAGRLEDLAAYRYSKDALSPGAEAMLRSAMAERGNGNVKEIMALGKTNDASSMASFELMRRILQEAVVGKTEEKWLITFTEKAFKSVQERFGEAVVKAMGDPVAVDVGDERTSGTLRLVPTIIDPCHVLENLKSGILSEPDNSKKAILAQTLFFTADGLNDEQVGSDVKEFMDALLSLRAS